MPRWDRNEVRLDLLGKKHQEKGFTAEAPEETRRSQRRRKRQDTAVVWTWGRHAVPLRIVELPTLFRADVRTDFQFPVGMMAAFSTIRTTVRCGARVRCRTPLGTTSPWRGSRVTTRPWRSMRSWPSIT
jgi:hypothetical protein